MEREEERERERERGGKANVRTGHDLEVSTA